MNTRLPIILISIALLGLLLLSNKYWSEQWWITAVLAGLLGMIVALGKRLWDKRRPGH